MSLKGVVYISTFTARCWTNFGIRIWMKCKSYFSKWKITEYVWWSLRIYIAHKMSRRSENSQTFEASSSLFAPGSMLLPTPNQSSQPSTSDGPASAPSVDHGLLWETVLIGMSPLSSSANVSQLIPLLERALPSAKPSWSLFGWWGVIQKRGGIDLEQSSLGLWRFPDGHRHFFIVKVNISDSPGCSLR